MSKERNSSLLTLPNSGDGLRHDRLFKQLDDLEVSMLLKKHIIFAITYRACCNFPYFCAMLSISVGTLALIVQ